MEQCPYCKKYLRANQINEHVCDKPLKTVVEIPVIFSYETKTQKGNSVVVAMGFDGVLYRLTTYKNPLADETLQEHQNSRELDRTSWGSILISE